MIRIIIADDHPYLIRGIKALLETEPDIELVGEARNGTEALDLLDKNSIDMVCTVT